MQSRVATGIKLTWKDPLESFAYTLAVETEDFQEHVDAAFVFDDTLNEVLEALDNCEYQSQAFTVNHGLFFFFVGFLKISSKLYAPLPTFYLFSP